MFNRKQIEDLKTDNSKLSTANKVWVKLSDKKVHYKNICVNLKAKVQSLELKLSQYERYLEIEIFLKVQYTFSCVRKFVCKHFLYVLALR